MNLNYELPAWAEEKLPPVSEEKRYYSVPYDIGADGAWLSDSYLVVTQKKIYLLSEGSPAQCFALTDCEEAAAEANVGCGLLTIRYRGEKRFLVQYSGKHLARYAYIARGIRILCSGRTEKVESTEYEKICPNCGRAIGDKILSALFERRRLLAFLFGDGSTVSQEISGNYCADDLSGGCDTPQSGGAETACR